VRGRKPETKASAEALTSVPAPPMWLPDEAKAEWRRVAKVLVNRRVLTDGDLAALEGYALNVGLVRRAWKVIAEEGEYVDGKRHRAFTTITQSGAEARRLAETLGLTPTSRNKLPQGQPDDDLAGLDL